MNRPTATATATNLALAAIIAVGSLSALAVADPPPLDSAAVSVLDSAHWANRDCRPTPRPPLDQTESIKRLMLRSLPPGSRLGDFELDHIGPLCLGGQPLMRSNLQMQPIAEAIRKDDEEKALCRAVRAGRMSCADARQRILEWKPSP